MRRTRHPDEKRYSLKYVVDLAREKRAGMTSAEEILWERLRRGQNDGMHFRKQHPIGRYIADFYCHEAKLVIEVDGEYHNSREKYDRNRDEFIEAGGFTVLRFRNEDVLHRMDEIIVAIRGVVRGK